MSHQFIDRSLYTAIVEGRVDYLLRFKDCLEDAVTPNKNTLLHLAALFGQPHCVHVIIKSCPSLLNRVNFKGETPLHVASREGHSEVVSALIQCAKALNDELESGFGETTMNMLRLTSDNGDTALHKAVRYRHVDVVKLLVKEDPTFTHLPNNVRETPLYLAAEKGLEDCINVILKTCTSPLYVGPGGRNALHAAVIFDSEGSTMELLKWNGELVNVADQNGWTPFHYAASLGHVKRARQLLDSDQSIAYVSTEDDKKDTALHIAASRGHLDIIKDIISENPTCLEMVNGKGRNILHVAVENNEKEVIRLILQSRVLTSSFINQKDSEGNTPLHLLAASGFYSSDLVMHPKAEIVVFNNENLTPMDIAFKCADETMEGWKYAGIVPHLREGIVECANQINTMNPSVPKCTTTLDDDDAEEDKLHKCTTTPAPITLVSHHTSTPAPPTSASFTRVAAQQNEGLAPKTRGDELVVVALIVTVTFAAGFTMPGGYIGNEGPNQGMAALTRVAAFRAFVISDALAFFFSCIALFIHYSEVPDGKNNGVFLTYALSTILAILAMMVAFTTGTYAVLMDSLGLAVTITILFCCTIVIFVIITIRDEKINGLHVLDNFKNILSWVIRSNK